MREMGKNGDFWQYFVYFEHFSKQKLKEALSTQCKQNLQNKNKNLPTLTYPIFFSGRYPKQTYFFVWP